MSLKVRDTNGTLYNIAGQSSGLELGETSTTAYRGDRGKIAYDDSQANKAAIESIKELLPSSEPTTWNAKTWNGLSSFDSEYIWTDGDNIYYSDGTDQYVLDKSTSIWTAKTWNGLTQFDGDNIWTDGTDIYYSTSYILNKATSTWTPKVWTGPMTIWGYNVWNDGATVYYSDYSRQYIVDVSNNVGIPKIWNGLTSFSGQNIWIDGENIYYSSGSDQYILDKSTNTWNIKTWNGLTNFSASDVWTDGTNIYCSSYSYDSGTGQNVYTHYVLNKDTSTWSSKTWNGLTNFKGNNIWTDGENIYCSDWSSDKQFVLDKSTSTWTAKTWNGYSQIGGAYVWTDGIDIYFSSWTNQYVLRRDTDTWEAKTWTNLSTFDGDGVWTDGTNTYYSGSAGVFRYDRSEDDWILISINGEVSYDGNDIWTDGENVYHSYGSGQHILNKSTGIWMAKTWKGETDFDARYVWVDGENVYISDGSSQYVLDKSTSTWIEKTWNGLTSFQGYNTWTDGVNIYCSRQRYDSETGQYVYTHYILNRNTSTWSEKTWIGLTDFNGEYIWTDGDNTYYSYRSSQYVLKMPDSIFGTAAQKNATNAVASGSGDLVESGAVYTALQDKQDTLIAGEGITIAADGKTISAAGGGGTLKRVSLAKYTDTNETFATALASFYSIIYAQTAEVKSKLKIYFHTTNLQSTNEAISQLCLNYINTGWASGAGTSFYSFGNVNPKSANTTTYARILGSGSSYLTDGATNISSNTLTSKYISYIELFYYEYEDAVAPSGETVVASYNSGYSQHTPTDLLNGLFNVISTHPSDDIVPKLKLRVLNSAGRIAIGHCIFRNDDKTSYKFIGQFGVSSEPFYMTVQSNNSGAYLIRTNVSDTSNYAYKVELFYEN